MKDAQKLWPTEENFWIPIFKSWFAYTLDEPDGKLKVLEQLLWYNSKIKMCTNVIFWPHWHHLGINFIKDIWSEENQRFYTFEEICEKYGKIPFTEFYGLKKVTPESWKRDLVKPDKANFEAFQTQELSKRTVSEIYQKLVQNDKLLYVKWKKWKEIVPRLSLQ